MSSVKLFSCPDVRIPPSTRKRQGMDMGWELSQQEINQASQDHLKNKASKKCKVTDIGRAISDVKDFSSVVLKGQSKIDYKNKKLTELGVAPPKQQTMPFKMRMAINRAKEKRGEASASAAKESGLVQSSSMKKKLATSRGKKFDKKNSGNPDVNIRTKGGVFHLSKDRIPTKLLSSKTRS